jgi:hypothetical protein
MTIDYLTGRSTRLRAAFLALGGIAAVWQRAASSNPPRTSSLTRCIICVAQNSTSRGPTEVTLSSTRYRAVPAATKYNSSRWCGTCGSFVGRAANRIPRSPSTDASADRPGVRGKVMVTRGRASPPRHQARAGGHPARRQIGSGRSARDQAADRHRAKRRAAQRGLCRAARARQLTAPDREVVELFVARLRRQIAAEAAEAAAAAAT